MAPGAKEIPCHTAFIFQKVSFRAVAAGVHICVFAAYFRVVQYAKRPHIIVLFEFTGSPQPAPRIGLALGSLGSSDLPFTAHTHNPYAASYFKQPDFGFKA